VIASPEDTKWVDEGLLTDLTGRPVRSMSRIPREGEAFPPADAIVVAPATFNDCEQVQAPDRRHVRRGAAVRVPAFGRTDCDRSQREEGARAVHRLKSADVVPSDLACATLAERESERRVPRRFVQNSTLGTEGICPVKFRAA